MADGIECIIYRTLTMVDAAIRVDDIIFSWICGIRVGIIWPLLPIGWRHERSHPDTLMLVGIEYKISITSTSIDAAIRVDDIIKCWNTGIRVGIIRPLFPIGRRDERRGRQANAQIIGARIVEISHGVFLSKEKGYKFQWALPSTEE